MSKSSKQPEFFTFRCPLTVEAADGPDKQMPRFRMVAYTGGVMRIAGFPHPVVVDLEGLAIDRQDIPVRLDHNPRQGVGHTQRVVIENGQVVAEGLVSRDTSWARDVAKSGVNGFPWQASIGAAVVDAEFIPNGQHVTVNGRTFDGPLHVVRKAILKEISFVDSGADTATSARIAANSKETDSMDGNDTTTATAADNAQQDAGQTDAQTQGTDPQQAAAEPKSSPTQEPKPQATQAPATAGSRRALRSTSRRQVASVASSLALSAPYSLGRDRGTCRTMRPLSITTQPSTNMWKRSQSRLSRREHSTVVLREPW